MPPKKKPGKVPPRTKDDKLKSAYKKVQGFSAFMRVKAVIDERAAIAAAEAEAERIRLEEERLRLEAEAAAKREAEILLTWGVGRESIVSVADVAMVETEFDDDEVEPVEPMAAEEIPDGPPLGVCVHSNYMNIKGGYRLCNGEEVFGKQMKDIPGADGSMVYYCEAQRKYLMYTGEAEGYAEEYQHLWVLAANPAKPLQLFFTQTTEANPDLSETPVGSGPWTGGCIDEITPVYRQYDLSSATGFRDKEFPPCLESLTGVDAEVPEAYEKPLSEAVWFRSTELEPNKEWVLFDGITPDDIMQGGLGNCWLMAAFAGVAEYPKFLRERVFGRRAEGDDGVSKDGRYRIRLWSFAKDCWEYVVVDDMMACKPRGWADAKANPCFAIPNGRELWVMLLEKAFAKKLGGYLNLDGGEASVAWMMFTGCREAYLWDLGNLEDGLATKKTAADFLLGKGDEDDGSVRSRRKMAYYRTKETKTEDEFYTYVYNCVRVNFFLAGASINNGEESEHQRDDGLVEGHAYTILDAAEVKLADSDDTVKMVQLRNPWGNAHEWSGRYSDNDEEGWAGLDADHMEEVGVKHENLNDGAFWMPFSEFFSIYSRLEVCCENMMRAQKATYVKKNARKHLRRMRATESAKVCCVCKEPIRFGDFLGDRVHEGFPNHFFHKGCDPECMELDTDEEPAEMVEEPKVKTEFGFVEDRSTWQLQRVQGLKSAGEIAEEEARKEAAAKADECCIVM